MVQFLAITRVHEISYHTCTLYIIHHIWLSIDFNVEKKRKSHGSFESIRIYVFYFCFFSIFQSSSLSWQMTSMNVWFGEYVHVSKKPLNYFFSSSSFFIFKNLFKDRWWCLCKCKYSIRHFIYQWIFVYIQLANNIYIYAHIYFKKSNNNNKLCLNKIMRKGKQNKKLLKGKTMRKKKITNNNTNPSIYSVFFCFVLFIYCTIFRMLLYLMMIFHCVRSVFTFSFFLIFFDQSMSITNRIQTNACID